MDMRDEVDTLAMLRGLHVERGVPMGAAGVVVDREAGVLAFAPGLSDDDELLLTMRALDTVDD